MLSVVSANGAVQCPGCGAANPRDARYCIECGRSLGVACNACGGTLPPSARFCPGCGAPRSAAAAHPPSVSRAGRAELVADREDDGELRQLTVMFCDLVDSTRLSQTLDPEDLRRVIQEYQHASISDTSGIFVRE